MTDLSKRPGESADIRNGTAQPRKTREEKTKLLFIDEETGIMCVLKDGVIHLIEQRREPDPDQHHPFDRWDDWTGRHWTDRLR